MRLGFVSKVPLPIREGLGEGRVARRFSPSPSLSPVGRGVLRQSLDLLGPALLVAALLMHTEIRAAEEIGRGQVYEVVELNFVGPEQGPTDTPSRDIEFHVRILHDSSDTEHIIHGFWDGDGKGGTCGDVFKIRFTPTRTGRWTLIEVHSSAGKLNGQHEGDYVTAIASQHPGFWMVDEQSAQGRWYRRSDGSHPYIIGNTHYSFLSGYQAGNRPSGNDIAKDVAHNAEYFKKLRFGLQGDRYPHPTDKPFLDNDGRPTDEGDFSHRPNPAWFCRRVDVAVQTAYAADLIADLILAGPDQQTSRSTLCARHNGDDPTAYLKYIAARYGSYPNVWICLCNEYDIKDPKFSEEQVAHFGQTIRSFLTYPTPLSVHATPGKLWAPEFDKLPAWNDHIIIQNKIRHLAPAADVIQQARGKKERLRHVPVVNDELSYQGAGDRHSKEDTIESHLGTFVGGGYGTTGEKPGNKLGQYFLGRFNPAEHTAADHLAWLRQQIDANITFWQMVPDLSIFSNVDKDFRGMAWPGHEYVLATNGAHQAVVAHLPAGTWKVTRLDVMQKTAVLLSEDARRRFAFDAPSSRAVLFHFKKL